MVFAYERGMFAPVSQYGQVRSFLYFHVPMLLYASAIITVSSIPDLKGPDLRYLPFDKVAHFGEYAVFAFLTIRSFLNLIPNMKLSVAYTVAVLFLAMFAALDEYYQKFVPGRATDLKDFATDMLGAGLVLVAVWIWRRKLVNLIG